MSSWRRRLRQSLISGFVIGALATLLAISPIGINWQENLDLAWLFALRGPIRPPPDVVVVAIDRRSADQLDVSSQPRDWPRSLHAKLVDRLTQLGASLIVFDLTFIRPQNSENDLALARALQHSGRVLLLDGLERSRETALTSTAVSFWVEELRRPLPILAEASIGYAPFPLPKYPSRVSRYWTFLKNDSRIPTLPVLALLKAAGSGSEHLRERTACGNDICAREDTLERMRAGPDSRYLNFYGGPGTIRTLPYAAVLNGDPTAFTDLKGAYVFVGYSDLATPSDTDSFATVYARPDGVEMAGVEIAATAFANLLTDRTLRHTDLTEAGVIFFGFCFLTSTVAGSMPALLAVPAVLTLAGAYVAVAALVFMWIDLWLPVAIPVLLILPLTVFTGLLGQYISARHQRSRMQNIVRYYVPDRVVQEMADHDVDPLTVKDTQFAVCLAMDAENFTTLSETLAPEQGAEFLNAYFAALKAPLDQYNADFTEFHADSVMCAWFSDEQDAVIRKQACLAGLACLEAIETFNKRHQPLRLGVRVGLHAGRVFLGNMGAGGNFAFRVMGDIVNTASRIEGLNKHIGTRLLATQEVVSGVDGLLLRPVGNFRMKGKRSAASVFEIRARLQHARSADRNLSSAFAEGLGAFGSRHYAVALARFEEILREHPGDGPSSFYRNQCLSVLASTDPATMDPVIQLESK